MKRVDPAKDFALPLEHEIGRLLEGKMTVKTPENPLKCAAQNGKAKSRRAAWSPNGPVGEAGGTIL